MGEMTGGEAIVQALITHGVDTLFGLPGVQNDWLYNALYDRRDQIRVIHTRHEQGAGYMALGYALASGDVGVCSVVPGPGFLNATAALATAYGLNAQVLYLVGQIPAAQIGKGKGQLHEIPDQLGIMRSLTKWAEQIERPAEVPQRVAEAFQQLHSGRPRPVGLEVPMDVLAQREVVTCLTQPLPVSEPDVDPALLEEAAKVLGEAAHPMIFVGGGAQGVSAEVRTLAERLQAPVVSYRTGNGVMDGRNELSLFLPAAHAYWQKADVVLAIGSYLRNPIKDWGVDETLKIIRIDIDPDSHAIIRRPDLAITARAETVLPQLVERLATYNRTRPSRKAELAALRARWAEQTAYLEEQLGYLKVIRDELGEEGIFVDELTQVGFASRITYPTYHPRTFISTGYQGTLGYGFPTALGVKVARPTAPVIAVTGDGGFMFAVQELATAVQHRIGLVTLLFNNNQYGNVQQMQRELYGNRVIASDLHNPDFVRMAESYGAQAFRVTALDELRRAIRQGFATDLPTLIEIPVGDLPSVDRFRRLPKVRGL
ncbi:MAG: thiamine pyrophosphate-binding protein [Caldilineaceae bacterium]